MTREFAPPPDILIARIAAAQHGAVTRAQLLAAGLAPASVAHRVASGRLHRLHHGIYAVGHRARSNHRRWKAAVLACGDGAALSHRSAAELWQLLPVIGGAVHVTVPGRVGRARRPGIRIHRPRQFDESLVTTVDGIEVTRVGRTLADLQGSVPASTRRRAIRQAEYLGRLSDDSATDRTRSDLERAFLGICRRYGLPRPKVNVKVGRYTVDFLWPEAGLVVEVDGYAAHRGRQAFRDDRDRDLDLAARGLVVQRIADSRIDDDPRGVAASVTQLLRNLRRGEK